MTTSIEPPELTFGQMLVGGRAFVDMTQSDLADIASVTQQTVSSWERGDTIPSDIDLHARLAAVLELDVDELTEAARWDVIRKRRELHGRKVRIPWQAPDPDADPPAAGALPIPLEIAALSGKLERLTAKERAAVEALIDTMLDDE